VKVCLLTLIKWSEYKCLLILILSWKNEAYKPSCLLILILGLGKMEGSWLTKIRGRNNGTCTNGFGSYQWAFGVIIFHIHVGRMMCRGGGDRTGSGDLP